IPITNARRWVWAAAAACHVRMVNRAMTARSIAGVSNKQPLNGRKLPPVPQENGVPVIVPPLSHLAMNSEPSRPRLVEGPRGGTRDGRLDTYGFGIRRGGLPTKQGGFTLRRPST